MAKPWDDYDDSNKMSNGQKETQIARGGGGTAAGAIRKIIKERKERQDYRNRQEQSPATEGKLS